MPQTFYITGSHRSSGIDITYYKTKRTLSIGGWYDGFVGIEGKEIGLKEFFDELGITEGDIKKVFQKDGAK